MAQFSASMNVADLDGANGFSTFWVDQLGWLGFEACSAGDIPKPHLWVLSINQ